MKLNKVMRCVKVGFLTVVILLSGVAFLPKQLEQVEAAALSGEDKVYYDQKTGAEFKELYVNQGKKAPVKEGYLFGGWYLDEGVTAITPQTDLGAITDNSIVYAKFVPAYVLSVKSQNYSSTKESEGGTPLATNKTTTRIVSTVDKSLLYSEVGFKVLINGREIQKSSTKVWEKLTVGNEEHAATKVFGDVSEYFFVLNINNIPETKWADQIYARPYWITEDGTEVEGLGKYVYVEDGLKNYISVPVNLHNVTDSIAAGILQVDYDETKLQYVGCITGRIFEETEASDRETDGNKYVKCVANVESLADVMKDDMYITLRFEVIADETLTSRETPYQFIVKGEDFVNVEETEVSLKVWDVQY